MACEAHGQEDVVEAQVRIPDGKGVALVVRVKKAIAVKVICVEHDLNRLALNVTPAQPDERANPRGHAPHIQQLARRERVEIPDQHMKTILMPLMPVSSA